MLQKKIDQIKIIKKLFIYILTLNFLNHASIVGFGSGFFET
jgi:hypothetical protein